MAETNSISEKAQQIIKQYDKSSNFYTRFLFKAIVITLFCVVFPIFISNSPEISNQTRLLELLHLIFVGIAVSYGLFSRRYYDGGGKENPAHENINNHCFDNVHSYLSRILQVSSVFDEDHGNVDEDFEPSDDSIAGAGSGGYSKLQTWRNSYQMNHSEVVTAKDYEKPLMLPVRSLYTSPASDSGEDITVSGENSNRRSNSKKRLFKSLSENSVNHSNVVLPSPIPWCSRTSVIESQPLIVPETGIKSRPLIEPETGIESRPLIKKPTSRSLSFDCSPKKRLHREFHQPPPPPPQPAPPAFQKSVVKRDFPGSYKIDRREFNHGMQLAEGSSKSIRTVRSGTFLPPPPPPEFYNSAKMKHGVNEHGVSSDRDGIDAFNNHPHKESEKEETSEFLEKRSAETDEEEEEGRGKNGEGEEGRDVDKKADEFIAKFREQIRLQRIESIKRSATAHFSGHNSST